MKKLLLIIILLVYSQPIASIGGKSDNQSSVNANPVVTLHDVLVMNDVPLIPTAGRVVAPYYNPSIKELNLSGLDLDSIDDIRNITINHKPISQKQINILKLSNNRLKNLPDSLNDLNISGLYLNNNLLKNIPAVITHNDNLKRLSINNNRFTQQQIQEIKNLAHNRNITLVDIV